MKSPRQLIEAAVAETCQKLFGPGAPAGPYVKPCPDPRHGDFQTNVALAHAKAAGKNPRELAQQVVSAMEGNPIFEKPEIAGPGFINFRLRPGFCATQLSERQSDPRIGIPLESKPQKIVFDFSGPNIAKEMHVGHLRSTILGDTLSRIYRFLGHEVVSDNHLGDWGTQFGMVILGFKTYGSEELLKTDPFGHLEALYKKIQEKCKQDEAVLNRARQELVKLQQGDPENLRLWKHFVELSLSAANEIYQRLGIHFDYTLGESFYHDRLAGVVDELVKKGIARESEGAVAVFSDGTLPQKEDPFLVTEKGGGYKENPFLIRKSDGAFLYSTTDLATVQFRIDEWKAQRAVYVTDSRQQMHFQQLFATVKRWGLNLQLDHVWFGAILGEDKTPIKTREGKPIKLKALLDEAEQRAAQILKSRAEERAARNPDQVQPELSEEKKAALVKAVGLGALKYADLAQNRNLDYVFNWDKLLAFDGNTAPYLQNAYVRIRSIFRKAGLAQAPKASIVLTEEAELALAKKLLDFNDSILWAADEFRPHYLCIYLFELATLFHKFYEACPVLKAEDAVRDSRLALSEITASTLKQGLNLLGISVVEEM